MSANANGHYAPVNGLNMYYEIHDDTPGGASAGVPLVLLHGATMTIDGCFGRVIGPLAGTRRIIAVEQQAHGHTADIDRPLTYEQMADDVAELLRQLHIQQADFFGFSMGAVTSLHIAVRHPTLVRNIVSASGLYNNEGYLPVILESIHNTDPVNSDQWAGEIKKEFLRIAPRPEQWPAPIAKTRDVVLAFRGIQPDQLRGIQSPTLIMTGDADAIRLEHTVEMFRLLPHAQLAVFPGTDHGTMMNNAEWLMSMVPRFLDRPADRLPV